jgi:hypothetical protein
MMPDIKIILEQCVMGKELTTIPAKDFVIRKSYMLILNWLVVNTVIEDDVLPSLVNEMLSDQPLPSTFSSSCISVDVLRRLAWASEFDAKIAEARDATSGMSDKALLRDAARGKRRHYHSVLDESVAQLMDLAAAYLHPIVLRAAGSTATEIRLLQERELSRRIHRESASRQENELRKIRADFLTTVDRKFVTSRTR